ncbi:TetR/AcrR family transcriptional regulator [Streptomyces sp. NPDC059153]|uniref:TetR/AcrR family transcriptional regulator n=1 Tax=Streptomyces sp. NPDC059153 TaxID=3346743 RepID=UPI0036C42C8E
MGFKTVPVITTLAVTRELAEAEGWEAVTIRHLAERVEYSQPVLYSHFKGKDAMVAAVAEEGFAGLAELLRDARTAAGARAGERPACGVPVLFALRRRTPGPLQAMFVMPTQLKFASEERPTALRAAFDVFVEALPEETVGREAHAELLWAALHGISTLSATGRIPAHSARERLVGSDPGRCPATEPAHSACANTSWLPGVRRR